MEQEFFNNTCNIPQPLTKQETLQLLKRMYEGDLSAKNELITHNIRLVIYEVRAKFSTVEYSRQDLVSSGIIGLIKAISSFDISKNIELATYAITCIDNEILMFLRKIAKYKNIDSLEKIINISENGDEWRLEDIIASDIDLLDDYVVKEEYLEIRNLLANLPEREREIIMMQFGFYENRLFTQEEIAKIFNLSQPSISRISKKVLKKLKIQLKKTERT